MLNDAVYVVAAFGTTIWCDNAPPSLQLEKAYCVPSELAAWGVVVAIVCALLGFHWKTCGATYDFPSTEIARPGGVVAMVMFESTPVEPKLKFCVSGKGGLTEKPAGEVVKYP